VRVADAPALGDRVGLAPRRLPELVAPRLDHRRLAAGGSSEQVRPGLGCPEPL
jgi:hypothetical protein